MGGAWPVRFTLKVTSNIDLVPTNGVYLTLQHSKLIPGFEVFNFVASSCDFGANTEGFSFAWDTRTLCYPISPDLEVEGITPIENTQPTSSTPSKIGSGIFWKMSKLIHNKQYELIVWGVADVCANQNVSVASAPENRADPLQSEKSSLTQLTFSFSMSIYKAIDQTKRGANRFNSNDLLATGSTNADPKCWSTFRGQSIDTFIGGSTQKGWGYELYTGKPASDLNGQNMAGVKIPSPTAGFQLPSAQTTDQCAYKEFADWAILYSPTDPTPAPATTGYESCIKCAAPAPNPYFLNNSNWSTSGAYGWELSGGVSGYKPLFLFSSTPLQTALGSNHGVLIRGDFAYNQGPWETTTYADLALPLPIVQHLEQSSLNNYAGLKGTSGGKFEMLLSKAWFTNSAKTSSNCVLSTQIGTSLNTVGVGGNQASIVWSPSCPTCKGYHISYMQLGGSPILPKAWTTNPGANSSTMSLNLDNFYIYQDTLDTSNTILPTSGGSTIPTLKIASVAQTALTTAPGGSKFTLCPFCLAYQPFSPSPPSDAIRRTLSGCYKNANISNRTCIAHINFYTNCVKWVNTSPTQKNLFTNIDVVWRFFPAIATTIAPNGPNRVIRFVKLFPEAQVFQDLSVKNIKSGTTINPVIFHWNPSVAESGSVYQGYGTYCLVELNKDQLSVLGTATSNTLAVFIYNMPLMDVDASDPTSTYPIGSLNSGVTAWGYSSIPPFSNYGQMGCLNLSSSNYIRINPNSSNPILSQGNGASGLTNMITETGGAATNISIEASKYFQPNYSYTLPAQGNNTSNGRSLYHFLLGSIVLFTGIKPSLGCYLE